MKTSHMGFFAILLVVLTLAFSGCTGSTPSDSPMTSSAGAVGTSTTSQQSSAPSDLFSGSEVLGGVAYDWVEYRITSAAEGQQMSMYFKYNKKTGKCTMRVEGVEDTTGVLSNMDCSSTGSSGASSDPNEIGSDVKMTKLGSESVTVPAGTFVADKYMATSQGTTAIYWIAAGKPLIRMEGGSAEGRATMELAGWG